MTQPEREAILDLLVLSLFVDAHISLTEEDTLKARIQGLGWESEKPREIHFLNAISKARAATETPEKLETFIAEKVSGISAASSRETALDAIHSVLASDGRGEDESQFLALVRKHLA